MSVDDDPGATRPGDAPGRDSRGGRAPLWGPNFTGPGGSSADDVPFASGGTGPSDPFFAHQGHGPVDALGQGGPIFVKPTADEPIDEERPWAWYVGLVAVVVAFLGVIFLSVAVLYPAAGIAGTEPTKFADQNEHWFGLGQDALWIAVACLVPFAFARHLKPSQLGMRRPPVLWKAVVWFFVAIVLFYVIAAVYSTVLGLDDKSNTLLDDNSGFGSTLTKDIAYALLYTVAAPVAEELLFRGLLFRTLRDGLSKKFRRGGVWYAAIISGVIFGGIHYTPGPINQNKFIPVLMMLGVMLALAYSFSGTIYVNILIHAINNALATGANTEPTKDWIFVLIGVGPLLAMLVTFLLSRFVRAVFRSEPPNRAPPPSAEPAIV